VKIQLPKKDKWNSTRAEVQYDPGFVAYLGFIFDPQRACIDAGANVGKITRFLAQRTSQRVTAFEPAPTTFRCLQKNTRDLENVVLMNCALGSAKGVSSFVGDGTVTAHLSDGKRGQTIGVSVVTLDEYLDGSDVGLIKIDVEGGEAGVLAGAQRTIQRSQPLLAIEVIDQHLRRGKTTRADLFRLVEQCGRYRAVNKYGMRETAAVSTGSVDIFFLPPSWYAPNLSKGFSRLIRRTR